MWTWSCSACPSLEFEGATKEEAQGKFLDHVKEEHPRAAVLSIGRRCSHGNIHPLRYGPYGSQLVHTDSRDNLIKQPAIPVFVRDSPTNTHTTVNRFKPRYSPQ